MEVIARNAIEQLAAARKQIKDGVKEPGAHDSKADRHLRGRCASPQASTDKKTIPAAVKPTIRKSSGMIGNDRLRFPTKAADPALFHNFSLVHGAVAF